MLGRIRSTAGRQRRRARQRLMRLAGVNVLDSYAGVAPSPQAALDIFDGEWASRMPAELGDVRAGEVALFEDDRITWLAGKRPLDALDVLELGPLEAGHSYMLQRLGARRVTAVEGNSRAYLKCLVVKELAGLDRVDVLHGDLVEYLRGCTRRFDLCVASGVLYHMRDPVELIALIGDVTDEVFVWTHYHDEAGMAAHPHLLAKFGEVATLTHGSLRYRAHRYEYGAEALGSQSFCGGSAPFSYWLERDGLLSCLRDVGLTEIDVAFDHPDHPNGPGIAVLARRPR